MKRFAILLTVTFVFTWLLTPTLTRCAYSHTHGTPKNIGELGAFGDQFGSITALFSGLSLVGVAAALWFQSKELKTQIEELNKTAKALGSANEFTAVHALFDDYKSDKMLDAVWSIWDYYRRRDQSEDRVKHDYIKAYTRETFSEIDNLANPGRVEWQQTIHHKRRLVETFYHLAATAIDAGMISSSTFYSYWSKEDLEIIPKIILPMGCALDGYLGKAAPHAKRNRLMRLFDDAPQLHDDAVS